MANDQNRDQNRDHNRDQGGGQSRDRTIGEGMNSPDSTQMPLKASTGEPDWDTQTNRNQDRSQGDRSASDSASADAADAGRQGAPRGARQNTGGDTGT